HTDWVFSVAFSPDGKHIVSGSIDRSVRIWDAESGEQLGDPLEGHTGWVQSVAFPPDGKHIVSGSIDKSVRIWDAEGGEQLGGPLQGHTDGVRSVAFSPDGKHVVSGSGDESGPIWDVESGEQLDSPRGHPLSSKNSGCSSTASTSNPSSHWQLREGWVSQNASELLFWLPSQHRLGFWMPENTLVVGRQQTKLSYETFVHGTEWTKCYDPEARAGPL
ncbi:WD40-repeat-containing domain protein, partial [Mycena vitilis]